MTQGYRRVVWIVAGFLAALGIGAAVLVMRARMASGGTPGWDESIHGYQGYTILRDIATLNAKEFYWDVISTRFRYPFGHSLLLVPAYAVFGGTVITAVGVSSFLLAVIVPLLFFTGRRLAYDGPGSEDRSIATGMLAAVLALMSPVILGQGSTIMLEMPAAVLTVVLVFVAARSLEVPDSVGRLRALGWTITLFVLTAAQYATFWILTTAAFELLRLPREERLRLWTWTTGLMTRRALLHPLLILVYLCLASAAVIVISGGWDIKLKSRTLHIQRPTNAIVIAFVLLTFRLAWAGLKRREELRTVIPLRFRVLFSTVVVPCCFWFLIIYPPRLMRYLNWSFSPVANIPRTSGEYWTYYPEYLATLGHSSTIVAVVVAILVLASFFRRDLPERLRYVRLGVAIMTVMVFAHRTRQDRYILPLLPAAWLLASDTATAFLARLKQAPLRWAWAAVALALLAIPGPQLYGARLPELVDAAFCGGFEFDYASVVKRVADEAAGAQSVRILGSFPGVSDALLTWEIRARRDDRHRVLKYELEHPTSLADDIREPIAKSFERWIATSPEEIVLCIDPDDMAENAPPRNQGMWTFQPAEAWERRKLMRGTARYAPGEEWAFPKSKVTVVKYVRR